MGIMARRGEREGVMHANSHLDGMLLAATAYAERYLTLLCNFSFVFLFVALENIN